MVLLCAVFFKPKGCDLAPRDGCEARASEEEEEAPRLQVLEDHQRDSVVVARLRDVVSGLGFHWRLCEACLVGDYTKECNAGVGVDLGETDVFLQKHRR